MKQPLEVVLRNMNRMNEEIANIADEDQARYLQVFSGAVLDFLEPAELEFCLKATHIGVDVVEAREEHQAELAAKAVVQ